MELAAKGIGTTSPNPRVGAVAVKGSRVIAEGFHLLAGGDHAEASVLRKARAKLKGATLYVTLEPCAHFGRTPPCADALVRSGVSRVVIGEKDPNPVTAGRGVKKLKSAGIRVTVGVLEKEVHALNLPFWKWLKRGLPYVTLKAAQSLDGKIADSQGRSKWISSPASRKVVQRLRAQADAILCGVETVLKDNPRLDLRERRIRYPYKVILDSRLRTPSSARLFKTNGKVILAATRKAGAARINVMSRKAEVIASPAHGGRVDIKFLLRQLAKRGILHVLVEGGGEVIGDFVRRGLADEVYFFTAPILIGGKSAPGPLMGEGAPLARAVRLEQLSAHPVGPDFLFHAFL